MKGARAMMGDGTRVKLLGVFLKDFVVVPREQLSEIVAEIGEYYAENGIIEDLVLDDIHKKLQKMLESGV